MADEKMIKVLVARDYWDADGERVVAGSEVGVSADAAMEGIESGSFKRIPKDK